MEELKVQESEALDIIESLLDVADMKNTGPMYADNPPRSGMCRIPEDDAAKLRQYIADRRAAPENKALTNADRITSSPKELADFLFDTQNAVASGEFWRSTQDILNWLNQPYARKPERSEKP